MEGGINMSGFNFIRRCHNCGAILQGDDPHKPGYIHPEALKLGAKVLFCDSCFEESKYNFSPKTPKVDEDYLSMLEDAEASDALIVYCLDLFSFENSFIPEVTSTIQGLPLIVVANKRDLLPLETSDEELREYVAHRCRADGLTCVKDDVMLVSLAYGSDVSGIWEIINAKRRAHDVYVIGASGSGKTQLISALLHHYSNPTGEAVGYKKYPGTELTVMSIPLDMSSYLYDTPGTSLSNSVVSRVDETNLARLLPVKAVEPTSFRMAEGDSLFIGGIARVELHKGERTDIDVYVAPKVDLIKTRSEDPEKLFFKKLEKGAIIPTATKGKVPSDYDAYELTIDEVGRRDIGIAGLGWFSFEGNHQQWRIYVLKGVGLYATRAKIKTHAK